MKKVFSLIMLFALAVVLFTSCKKDKGEPPVLPPEGSMVIDFSNFATPAKSALYVDGSKGTVNSNWEFASFVASVWNVYLGTSLAVPVASFKAAVDKSPVWIKEKTWQWSFTVNVGSASYKARLTGEIGSSEVIWKMYLSKDGTGSFPEFIWYEGSSEPDGSSGQWILKQSAAVQENFMQIDWEKTGNALGQIKYTYIKGDDFKNSYIQYGLGSGNYNAFYNVHYYNGVKFSDVQIEWNTTTKNGRVKSVDYLGDANWYCWDSNRINTTCQ